MNEKNNIVMSCNIDPEYLEKLSKMAYEASLLPHCGRSYNKMALIEAQCISRIESLHKEAESVGINSQYIDGIYHRAKKIYRENITQYDFLHTYEEYLKDVIRRFKYNLQGSTISIAELIKVEETINKKNYYLSRDWIRFNKLIKKRK